MDGYATDTTEWIRPIERIIFLEDSRFEIRPVTIPIAKVKVANLREKSQAELTQTLDTYKRELMDLKVQQVAGAAAAKSSKIRDVRRNVARVLTVLTQQARTEVRGQYAKKKYIPKDLRAKKTRALRRALTKNELSRKTLRQQKKEDNFPIREFAIKA